MSYVSLAVPFVVAYIWYAWKEINKIVIEMANGTKYSILNSDFGLVVDDATFAVYGDNIIKVVGVGPTNLLNCTSLRTYPGNIPTTFNITTDTSYKVYGVDGSGNRVSQIVQFNIVCKRSYNKYQIFYFNNMGQFDSVSFNNGNWKDYSMKTTTYRQNPYKMISGKYTYTNGNRGLTTLNKQVDTILTVVTSYDLYPEVIESMLLSSVHFLVDGETIIPLVLDTEKMTIRDKMSGRMDSFEIAFTYANKININK